MAADYALLRQHFQKISLAAPVYNELQNLPILYQEVVTALEPLGIDWELILVDDGSTDGSRDVLKDLAAKDARVKVLFFRRNFGQTAAMQAGFHYATGDVVVMLDADLQNDPADTPKLLAKLAEGWDVVSGWRKHRKDKGLTRRLPSKIANRIIANATGVRLHDYGCSLKAYRREFVEDIRLYGEMHRFIPVYCKQEGARITETEVNHRARRFGQGKYGLGRTFKVIFDLMLVRFMARYWQKPIYAFGHAALRMLVWAFLVILTGVGLHIFGQAAFWQTPLPTMATVLITGAAITFGLGLIAEQNSRTYYESQHRRTYQVRQAFNVEVKG